MLVDFVVGQPVRRGLDNVGRRGGSSLRSESGEQLVEVDWGLNVLDGRRILWRVAVGDGEFETENA